MTSTPEVQLSIRYIGEEKQPLVILDGYSGVADKLHAQGCQAQFQQAGAFYPGLRAPSRPDLIDMQRKLVTGILEQVFGLRQEIVLEMLAYALVTTPRDELAPMQSIPHYDHSGDNVVAGMFYMLGKEAGGTAFYRHRETGFETITQGREAAYRAAVVEELRNDGSPAGYYHGDGDHYEMLEEVESRPDRLILYRGNLLHSGVIPQTASLSRNPALGRLTMNMFFRGQ